jgi:hypothetical protein
MKTKGKKIQLKKKTCSRAELDRSLEVKERRAGDVERAEQLEVSLRAHPQTHTYTHTYIMCASVYMCGMSAGVSAQGYLQLLELTP